MIKKILIILMFLLISFNVFSKIRLNVGIVYKKGIDKGLVLISEYHSIEEVNNFGMTRIRMKNDLEVLLTASFFDNDKNYGPTSIIKIDGQLFLRQKKMNDSFFNEEILISIGEKKVLIYKNDIGHQVELSITPEIR